MTMFNAIGCHSCTAIIRQHAPSFKRYLDAGYTDGEATDLCPIHSDCCRPRITFTPMMDEKFYRYHEMRAASIKKAQEVQAIKDLAKKAASAPPVAATSQEPVRDLIETSLSLVPSQSIEFKAVKMEKT